MNTNKLQSISRSFFRAFLVFSILNIVGLFFQSYRTKVFMEANPEAGNYLGMLFVAVFFLEIYFLALAFWAWLLTKMKSYPWLHVLQLILLFAFGILFGIVWCFRLFTM